MSKEKLIAYIKALIDENYAGSQVAFAKNSGMSASYISDILKGRRDPGQKFLDAIGMKKIILYRNEENYSIPFQG